MLPGLTHRHDQASLGAIVHDKSGFGGHTDKCKVSIRHVLVRDRVPRVGCGVGELVAAPQPEPVHFLAHAHATSHHHERNRAHHPRPPTHQGMGPMAPDACRHALLLNGCDVLSYKDGRCFLHVRSASDFWSDTSMGNWAQTRAGVLL